MIQMKWSKPVLWLIIGRSGAGKDTVARMLGEMGWNVLCSYTTRPRRKGEQNMREHIFIDEAKYYSFRHDSDMSQISRMRKHAAPTLANTKNEIMAYTLFGGFHYFTLCRQVSDTMRNAYVIDEVGANELIRKFSSVFTVRTLNIMAFSKDIKARGVDEQRMSRDKDRIKLCVDYDYAILNGVTLPQLKGLVADFVDRCEGYEKMEV